MEKNFQPGKGTLWEIGNPLQTINGIRTHALPDDRREQIDFTGNEDEAEVFVNGPLEQSDEFTLQINFDPENAVHTWLIENVGKQHAMKVTTKNAAGVAKWVYTFDVNIARRHFPPHGNNEPARLDVTFRPSGTITRAAAPA